VSGANGKPSGSLFVWWWLGGFSCAGALVGGTLAAVYLNGGVLGSFGIALIGAILSLGVGTGIAEVLVSIAEELGWDEKAPTPRIGRVVQRMEQVTDSVRF
jgi:hypothetical protein